MTKFWDETHLYIFCATKSCALNTDVNVFSFSFKKKIKNYEVLDQNKSTKTVKKDDFFSQKWTSFQLVLIFQIAVQNYFFFWEGGDSPCLIHSIAFPLY